MWLVHFTRQEIACFYDKAPGAEVKIQLRTKQNWITKSQSTQEKTTLSCQLAVLFNDQNIGVIL